MTALCVVVLAVALPQCVHFVAGATGGMVWLPIYLPVLLGGCLLGVRWGMTAGIAAPIVSFLVTSAVGEAMPAVSRLPFMAAELAVMALITGLFARTVSKRPAMAFVAVPTALLGGRAFFLLTVFLFQALTPLTPASVLHQLRMGIPGMILQTLVLPLAVIALAKAAEKEGHRD